MNNYEWSADGKTVNCSETMGAGCSNDPANPTKQGNIIYFPISGSPGDVVTLNMNANDADPENNDYETGNNTGLTTNLSQQFLIVQPTVKITADGTSAWSSVLGEFTPLDPENSADSDGDGVADNCDIEPSEDDPPYNINTCINTSQSVFGTSAGSTVTLTAVMNPSWLNEAGGILSYRWFVDGEEVAGSGNTVSFVAGQPGEAHNVQIEAHYGSNNPTQRTLNRFGSIGDREQVFADSVLIEVHEGGGATTGGYLGSKKIFASLISNIPSQTIFMLRIALTIFVIILVSHIISTVSLMPRNYAFQNKIKK
jgi:hypothetical protein